MPQGCSPSCLDDRDVFLQIHQDVTHTAETQHLPRAGWGRALGTLKVAGEGMEDGLGSGETIRQQLLVLPLLCQFGKLSLPYLLWGFLPSSSDFHQPSPTLYSQPGCAFVCSSLQLRTGCWITFGIETSSYWKSNPRFLSQWHLRPAPTFLAYSVLCRASSVLKSRDRFGVCALLYLPLPLEEKQILTMFPPCIHNLIYISYFYCPELKTQVTDSINNRSFYLQNSFLWSLNYEQAHWSHLEVDLVCATCSNADVAAIIREKMRRLLISAPTSAQLIWYSHFRGKENNHSNTRCEGCWGRNWASSLETPEFHRVFPKQQKKQRPKLLPLYLSAWKNHEREIKQQASNGSYNDTNLYVPLFDLLTY